MTEEKFDEFLRKTAQGYNAPPTRSPREDMWKAIQAARQAGPRVVYGAGSSPVARGDSRFVSRVWWSAAAAAVLVATGVGIGRWTASTGAPAAVTSAAVRPAPSDRTIDDAPTSDPIAGNDPALIAQGGNSGGSGPGAVDRSATPDVRSPRGTERSAGVSAGSLGAAAPGSTSSSAYQVAAVNHLTQAEALLTSFRTRSAADQRVDAQLASWARELLSNTRLLLDSPVAVDPERRPLLQDLELLLVQIVQLSPGSTPQDREIIEQTLKQDQVLTRLRTAIPAGQRGS